MCEIDLTPCISCGRRYGHLDDCRIKALHQQLDEMIREHGVNIAFFPKPVSRRDEVARYGVCHPGMRCGEEYIVDAENVFAAEP